MRRLVVSGLAALIAVLGRSHAAAAIDRNPELKSRALAWTEFDGSYLVDTHSRAEMVDFFWNVFYKPYPELGWTGSFNPPVAGRPGELHRIREYAQLNAYRALNGSPPMVEDISRLDWVQAAAFVFGQNTDRGADHIIDETWIGYNETAREAALGSLITGSSALPLSGAADYFIIDSGLHNARAVGHRMRLLHENSTTGVVGAVPRSLTGANIAVWYHPLVRQTAPLDQFIAYPSPGYFPLGLLRGYPSFRWSFVPANDWTAFAVASYDYPLEPGVDRRDTTVTAKINGREVAVNELVRNGPPGPLTWDFRLSDFDHAGDNVLDGTKVEITVHDVAVLRPGSFVVTGYRNYTYTVTFFDEKRIVPVGYGPQTPLVNISTRSTVGSGERQMITGFSVVGTTPVRVAVRAQGPTLRQYGLSHTAGKTRLRIFDSSSALLGENANWKDHPNWRLLQSLQLQPGSETEAAMVLTLWPGTYTAVASDDTGADGVGIVEAFNIDNLSQTRLANLSTRGVVGPADNPMIAGFVIKDTPRTVIIRTQGPGLAKYGVTGVVADTILKVVAQSDGRTVAENDDWQSDPRNERLATEFPFYAPTDAREAALLLTLPPGAYTALVSGRGPPGVGIIEVFDPLP